MIVAGLDFGTNTFLCLIAEIDEAQSIKVLSDQVQMVRLGQDVNQTKRFHPEALSRARRALEIFRSSVNKFSPKKIQAVATSASRDVQNKDELVKLCEEFSIPLQIISGETEAALTYRGALSDLKNSSTESVDVISGRKYFVIDVGGGSTEYVLGDREKIQARRSINMGCVRMVEAWQSCPPIVDLAILQNRFREMLKDEFQSWDQSVFQNAEGIAVAGTPTEIARMEILRTSPALGFDFPVEKIEGVRLDHNLLKHWLHLLAETPPEVLTQKFGVDHKRADVLFSGCLILLESLDFFGLTSFQVSTRGLRYGVVLDLFDQLRQPFGAGV